MSPSNDKPSVVAQHPTGTVTSAVAAILVALTAAGVDISPELASAIIGVVAAIASFLTPRNV